MKKVKTSFRLSLLKLINNPSSEKKNSKSQPYREGGLDTRS